MYSNHSRFSFLKQLKIPKILAVNGARMVHWNYWLKAGFSKHLKKSGLTSDYTATLSRYSLDKENSLLTRNLPNTAKLLRT